jgi:hypothetical protein
MTVTNGRLGGGGEAAGRVIAINLNCPIRHGN